MTIDNFFNAVEKNELIMVQDLVINGVDINLKNKSGSSALHLAVYKDFKEMIQLLLDFKININNQNSEGKTALHYVAEYNRISIAKVLLTNKADLSIQDIYGNQPLWTAVFNDKGRSDRVEIIELFLKFGADANHMNNVGKSPSDIVKIAGYKNLEKLLLRD